MTQELIDIKTEDQQHIGRLWRVHPDMKMSVLVPMLCRWRNQVREWFMDMREVTEVSTQQWLENVMESQNKVLFMIADESGDTIGTYGYTVRNEHTIEFGNLLRGKPGGHRKLIYYAEIALIRHVFSQGYVAILCEVLKHNEKVLNLHASTGAVVFNEVGLRREGEQWIVDNSGTDGRLIYQLHTPQTHQQAVTWTEN